MQHEARTWELLLSPFRAVANYQPHGKLLLSRFRARPRRYFDFGQSETERFRDLSTPAGRSQPAHDSTRGKVRDSRLGGSASQLLTTYSSLSLDARVEQSILVGRCTSIRR